MNEQIFSTVNSLGKLLTENRKLRIAIYIANIALIIAGVVFAIYLTFYGTKDELSYFYNFTSAIFFVPPIITFGSVILYQLTNHSASTEAQLDRIREERAEITQKIKAEPEHDIFNTIQLSLNQLNEYYTINKGQARSSFNFSIFAVTLGLMTILVGVWLHYFKMREISVVYITGFSGTVLEFIGGAYFFIYKKSLEQVNFFFSQLIKVQDTMLAIDLAKHNENAERRSILEEKIITSLLERSLK